MAVLRTNATGRKSTRLRILIVEDTPTVAAALQAGLHAAGMTTDLAETAAETIARKACFRPDLVLVDLGLADGAGFALAGRIADGGECGVIVVATGGEEAGRVAGADDFVVKPVRMQELAARIRAVHRRRLRPTERRSGTITIDRARHALIGPNGNTAELTEAELAALETLLDAEGASVSREWLSRVALRRELRAEDRSVDQLVLQLRRKLAAQGAAARVIVSVRRQGYVLPDARPFRTIAPPGRPAKRV
jgi:DNA-binding response OmpR family regulator